MRIAIFGHGGFGREVLRLAESLVASEGGARDDIIFVSDGADAPVIGTPVIAVDDLRSDDRISIAIGASDVRQRVAQRLGSCQFVSLIAPTAIIGPDVEIGTGAIFCDFTMVTASARIGRHFQCNIYSYVAHDCLIGDFVTFAPRVCCNGNVQIGDRVYIGTGAVIRQGTSDKPLVIGAGAVIGMGAVVTRDVAPGMTVVGNPARPMER